MILKVREVLYLIGLGLNDERDLGSRAKKIAENAECYCELYTSKWFGSIANLQAEVKNRIKIVDRKFLEEEADKFVEKARKKRIVLFVPGDPLCATTHINLLAESKKRKIKVRVIHNASIFSAVGETGLQLYKFGKTATVPFSGHIEAVKNALEINKKAGLHTLLLLDLKAEESTYMHPEVALELLVHKKVLNKNSKVIIASRLGKTSDIRFGTAKELMKTKLDTPAVIIVPGKLHFAEKEFLKLLEVNKKEKIKPVKIAKTVGKRVKENVTQKISNYTKAISKKIKYVTKLGGQVRKTKKSRKKK